MIADWILERLGQRLIVRLDLEKPWRSDLWPMEFDGVLISRTDRLDTPAGGFIRFKVRGHRLDHLHVVARGRDDLIERAIREETEHWNEGYMRPWGEEKEHVFKISHTHMKGDADDVPLSSLLAVQHLALTQGLLYQAERKSYTGLQKALLKNINYQFNKVVADANAKLFTGIL